MSAVGKLRTISPAESANPRWFQHAPAARNIVTLEPGQEDALDLGRTSTPIGSGGVTLEPLKDPAPRLRQQRVARAIQGTVLAISPESVLCEVRGDNGAMRVHLPVALFPSEIRTGTPVAIEMQRIGGVRTPVVSVRQVPIQNDPLIAEMDALIAELPE